ncbi:transposase, partial [Limosilactobacillus fermentum]
IRQPRRNRVKEQQQYLEDNVLHRQFAPDQPNKVWVTDTTELTYGRGNKVRLHAIIDLYGNYALSYFISPTETAKDVIKAFELAKQKTSRLAPLIHTDRGSAYTSREFSNYLIQNQCVHSMSAPGTPADNAVIERWWCDFKHLWLAHQPAPQTYDQLLKLVAEGVKYFNTVEISGKRKNLTAVDYYRSEIA